MLKLESLSEFWVKCIVSSEETHTLRKWYGIEQSLIVALLYLENEIINSNFSVINNQTKYT